MRKRAVAEEKDAPPALPRRSGKTNFFQEPNPLSNGSEKKGDGDASTTDLVGKKVNTKFDVSGQANFESRCDAKTGASNPFLQKLSKMESDSRLPSFPTYNAAAEERRKKIEAKIKAERSKMLIFRDVGMDLDKPILSRDVFLVLKYFRYGMDFAVDNELERMLRYFNEHATNELKIIQDSKLMRGPPFLSRKRRSASRKRSSTSSSIKPAPSVGASAQGDLAERGGSTAALHQQGLQFQISSTFPHVRCAHMRQFCSPNAFSAATTSKLATLLSVSHSSWPFASYFPSMTVQEARGSAGKSYNAKASELFTTMTPSMFRRPAVVIFSQLGQKFGSQADIHWRRLAYATICPGLLPYISSPAQEAGTATSGATDAQSPYGVSRSGPTGKDGSDARAASSSRPMPIDVISLRSADVYKYRWVQRLYVSRFAKSLSQTTVSESGEQPSIDEIKNALIASSTFVGSQLLEPFYATLGLRNYLLPHVMLVDHEGVIRWLSGGLPDADEKDVFPSLLRQLESDYLKAPK
ncbi:conserved hypothetical protein [Leishmania major strain Friedlin]|uniref:Uncharacterized protein n=1 Tax=Leishmania major TaxID=5664 RepID=Q4QEA6_LEIMA|nr:conserved hypothetical protein [Leishmania major strain Friedlin]CAG9572317.1 hypothetical_protein_-_conserved [Leishmania major strain Friedlin]CAJ03709.1 conserved hypothetical protein [Leishmania major strain Friedlin]|eukprot:XP_001682342.1 conserved hypothetical protein [Leishmania major strain Friedlin]